MGKRYSMHARTEPNADFGQTVAPAPPTVLRADSIGNLRMAYEAYRDRYAFGSGNWPCCVVMDAETQAVAGHVTFNGRFWPRSPSLSDTTVEYWAERDAQTVTLRMKDGSQDLVTWHDGAVEQAVQDGFLSAKGFVMGKLLRSTELHQSALDYYLDMVYPDVGAEIFPSEEIEEEFEEDADYEDEGDDDGN